MTTPRKPLPKMSPRKLAAQSGKPVYSTITAKPKAIKKVNPERALRRRKSYAQKLAAYRRSETYKIVEARAAGQCEVKVPLRSIRGVVGFGMIRCPARRDHGDRLNHHHKTYARFGGDELPEDMTVACDPCHAIEEAKHPSRKRVR